jgi:MFS family permease
VLGALMLLCGALADRYGRKRLFVAGVTIFAIGSLACAFAGSMNELIAARVLQAAGGTMLAPASLAMLSACFEGEARGKAIGTWSAFTAITSMIGPVAGGVLLDLAIGLALVNVRESRDEELKGRLDVAGSALVTAGLGAVVYAFIEASIAGWDATRVRVAMPAGIALLAAFWWWEGRVAEPILPRRLFASRAFSGINVMTFLLYAALGALFYFLPFVMIQADGYSATIAGAAMLPFMVLIVVLSRLAGGLVYRIGARTTLLIGSLVTACGYATFGLLGDLRYWPSVFPATVLVGIGMGLTVAPLTTTVMESVRNPEVGLASGVNNAVARVAGLLSVAICGFLLAAVFNARLDQRLGATPLQPRARTQVEQQRSSLSGAVVADPAARALVLDSYKDGFRAVALACAVLALASAGTAQLTLRTVKPS